MKIDKELMKEKFEKLNDTIKIRYNLGKIISMQLTSLAIMISLFGVTLMMILFLPFMINYGGFYGCVRWAFFGFLLMTSMLIFFIAQMCKIKKDEKALERFLMSGGKDE